MIHIHNASGGYGTHLAVDTLSLTAENGKITAIIGPNGCGKSTLLKLCCGQLSPKSGDILLNQWPVSQFSHTALAQTISYLPQSRTVPDITVGALVLHGRFPWLGYPRIYKARDTALAENAMVQTGILPKKNILLSALSGGERQKAYLAMMLAQNTEHVLLDEPNTYLDISHQSELMGLLVRLKEKGKAIVIVLHDINMALLYADTIAVLCGGRLLAAGTPDEILHTGVVEAAFGVQMTYRKQLSFIHR